MCVCVGGMAWYLSGGDVVGGVYWHVHAMWSVVDAVGYAGLYTGGLAVCHS